MKVKVSVTIDIDPESWDMNYGTGTNPKDVREDVLAYAHNLVTEQFREIGVLA